MGNKLPIEYGNNGIYMEALFEHRCSYADWCPSLYQQIVTGFFARFSRLQMWGSTDQHLPIKLHRKRAAHVHHHTCTIMHTREHVF